MRLQDELQKLMIEHKLRHGKSMLMQRVARAALQAMRSSLGGSEAEGEAGSIEGAIISTLNTRELTDQQVLDLRSTASVRPLGKGGVGTCYKGTYNGEPCVFKVSLSLLREAALGQPARACYAANMQAAYASSGASSLLTFGCMHG
jgi:hypothetical protein